MKLLMTALILLFVSCVALSQQPAKVNLMLYFDKVSPPPVTAKEAYEKCGNASQPDNSDAQKLFKTLRDELARIDKTISTPTETPAMGGSMKQEPQSVMDAFKEYQKLMQSQAQGYSQLGAESAAKTKYEEELKSKHKAVEDWKAQAIKNLPLHDEGEAGSARDPKAIYNVNLTAYKKHVSIADEHLRKVSSLWAEEKAKSKKMYAAYEVALEKTHYGDDAVNSMLKVQLAPGQSMMIQAITELIDKSQEAYKYAADWYGPMVHYEKHNKPE
jgi:hypothetical protein